MMIFGGRMCSVVIVLFLFFFYFSFILFLSGSSIDPFGELVCEFVGVTSIGVKLLIGCVLFRVANSIDGGVCM